MVRIHITSIAALIGVDPERNTRVQIALWWREQTPVSVIEPPPLEAVARLEIAPA